METIQDNFSTDIKLSELLRSGQGIVWTHPSTAEIRATFRRTHAQELFLAGPWYVRSRRVVFGSSLLSLVYTFFFLFGCVFEWIVRTHKKKKE